MPGNEIHFNEHFITQTAAKTDTLRQQLDSVLKGNDFQSSGRVGTEMKSLQVKAGGDRYTEGQDVRATVAKRAQELDGSLTAFRQTMARRGLNLRRMGATMEDAEIENMSVTQFASWVAVEPGPGTLTPGGADLGAGPGSAGGTDQSGAATGAGRDQAES